MNKTELYSKKRLTIKGWKKEWRWRTTNIQNGKIIGASTQGYSNKSECIANMNELSMSLTNEYLELIK